MNFRRFLVLIFVLVAAVLSYATAPQVTSTNPTTGATGTQVQINGSGFGATQGASTVKFNGSYVATVVSWSDTQIVATVPAQAFTGQILVTVGGVNSNQTVYFNVPAPQITSVSPTSGVVGTQVTVNGSGFQATKGANSSINFNGTPGTVVTWSDTQIVVTVAANATTGAVKVVVNSVTSNQDKVFTLPNPIVSGLAPSSGPVGTAVQINGSGFGTSQGASTVQFNGVTATATAWNDSSITATVPTAATSGTVLVAVGGVTTGSNVKFTIPPPQVNSISPTTGPAGTQVTVSGSGFQTTKGSSAILINGATATTSSWSDSQIVATIPGGATTGPVRVSVNNISSNQDVVFTIPNPIITAISPSNGPVGTQVTVSGVGFGATQGTSTLKFQGIAADVISSWSDTQIVATVPSAAITGYIQATVLNVTSHAGDVYFTVPLPQITSISPSSGTPGTQVTVSGSGFRSTQVVGGNSSTLSFNGVGAAITTWSNTQIVATVPASATTGPVKIGGYIGNSNPDVVFTTANPVITSLSPSAGPVGTQVQINGSGFGSVQGSGSVKITSNTAAIVSWSDTQIVATVPVASKSGSVTVTAGGVTSNSNINFTVPPPQITSITPASGAVGTQVTVSGSGFQATKGSNSISFPNGVPWNVVSWNDTQIVATIPLSPGTNPVHVTVNGGDSNNDIEFTLPNPMVSGFSPMGAPVGTQVQISGSGFGASQGSSSVSFNFTNASVISWSDTLITATVPAAATTGSIRVTVGGVTSGTGPAFTVSNLFVNAVSPAASPVGTQVTVTGSGFGSSQGAISFNNVAATTISSWGNTQIVATVPTGTTTGGVKVTVSGTSSNTSTIFTVSPVLVTAVNPTSGLPGAQIQISGSGFGTTQGTSTVAINGWNATTSAWSDGLITATVPSSATSGAVKVTVGSSTSNTTINFTVLAPVITGISPSNGVAGTQVQVTGSGFGSTQGASNFSFNGVNAAIVTWSDTSITATVPASAMSGRVWVAEGSQFSNTNLNFTVPDPKIVSIAPTSGVVGTQVTVNGSGFRSSQGSNSILFNGSSVSVVSWSDTQIVATVSAGVKTGPVKITGSIASNQDVVFTMPNPLVASLSPSTGPMGTSVQIVGSGFGASQGSSTVTFNNVAATATAWSDTSITATVPSTATSGVVAVQVGGVTSPSTVSFSVPLPHVSSVTPNVGTAGTQITVTGSGFHATQGPGNVVFNNLVAATIIGWSDTQIVATVPVGATAGAMTVWQNVYGNWDVAFSLISPRITGLVPASGPVGTQVQINGSGFGATQGSSTVTIGSVATVVSPSCS